MKIVESVLPYKPEFPDLLESYCDQMKEAIKQGKHHDQRRSLFMNFLRKAYGIEPEEVELEEKIKVANVRGWIDALYKYVIIEFKTDLETERETAKLELKKYFESRTNPAEYLALVSQGLNFEVYQYEAGSVEQIATFELGIKNPLASFRRLDDILFAPKRVTPKSEEIAARFGLTSPVFNKIRVRFDGLLEKVKSRPSVKVKFKEWNSLLAMVYGEELGDTILFIKHTYLTLLSRLMVAQALFPEVKRARYDYKGIMTGSFFAKKNLPNLAEPDFFSWALGTEVEGVFLGLVSIIDKALSYFRLDNIGEDVLKEVYQELVDPKSRHSLGEYYTPDWIADLAIGRIGYKRGTILDPACGSGTFLLASIRKLRSDGLKGDKLVRTVEKDVLGIDVHPLAVIMSKANILLGMAREVRNLKSELYLPVYMADTLLVYEERKRKTINITVSDTEVFRIPLTTTRRGETVDVVVDRLTQTCQKGLKSPTLMRKAWKGLERTALKGFDENELLFWRHNFTLYAKLVQQDRDSIWGFILKNAYRPAFIRQEKVDYIVGNPPWLAYRYVKDKNYKARVKELTVKELALLDSKDVKLFTQMDTSTLFFVYCEKEFLKKDGTIAFVLPKTTILPSKQHLNFQARGVSEIHDFSDVSPLFNVRSVLVIRNGREHKTQNIPQHVYSGKLPFKNMPWSFAKIHFDIISDKLDFLTTTQTSHYYPLFLQGATIVPRCFWFIQPDEEAAQHETAPYFRTSEEAYEESKEPWRIKLDGRVEREYLYETVLAKDLVPFTILRTELVFLPLQKFKDSVALADYERLVEIGSQYSALWMNKVEKEWEEKRQSEDRSLVQRLNYNQTLIKQNISAELVILYNTSGTNLATSLYIPGKGRKLSFKPNGFAADAVTYYYYPASVEEGDYLATVLNSDVVNDAIKAYQPQGLYGERHIHRRPFEVCAIPKFDPRNSMHKELAELGRLCREEIAPFVPQIQGRRIGELRLEVRRILKQKIAKINKLVEALLEAQGQSKLVVKRTKKGKATADLFE